MLSFRNQMWKYNNNIPKMFSQYNNYTTVYCHIIYILYYIKYTWYFVYFNDPIIHIILLFRWGWIYCDNHSTCINVMLQYIYIHTNTLYILYINISNSNGDHITTLYINYYYNDIYYNTWMYCYCDIRYINNTQYMYYSIIYCTITNNHQYCCVITTTSHNICFHLKHFL